MNPPGNAGGQGGNGDGDRDDSGDESAYYSADDDGDDDGESLFELIQITGDDHSPERLPVSVLDCEQVHHQRH